MRWKLVAGNVVAVIVVGLLAWVMTRSFAAEALMRDVDPSVERAVALVDAVRSQDGDQLLNAVKEAAAGEGIAAVYAPTSDSEQREAAFQFAQGLAQQMASLPRRGGRPPELVAITNVEGNVLARNIERRQDADRPLRTEFPVVAAALTAPLGRAGRDFIRYGEQGWLEVAVVPIVLSGQLRGALVVGYAVADSAARNDAARIGVDVGVLFREGDHFTVQSLSVGQQREKEQLRAWANDAGTNLQGLFSRRQKLTLTLGDEEYRAMVLPMPGVFTAQQAGVIVLRSVTDARSPASDVSLPILIFMLVGLLLVVVYNLFMANYLQRPIEQIEDGLLQVINGNQDFRIELEHAELGGIVYRVNQLVAELTGEEEETDEQGRISHPPARARPPAPAPGPQPVIDEAAMTAAPDPAVAQALAAEPENSYYERLKREYDDARRAAALPPDPQRHEDFVEMVRRVEQSLAQQHECTLVRFQVQARGREVVFRPVPIR